MKLIEMKRIKGDGAGEEYDWFVKFDTLHEEEVYNDALTYLHKVDSINPNYEYFSGMGYGMIRGLLCIGCDNFLSDDDIYYYFMYNAKLPEVGEEFTLDDITWERTA